MKKKEFLKTRRTLKLTFLFCVLQLLSSTSLKAVELWVDNIKYYIPTSGGGWFGDFAAVLTYDGTPVNLSLPSHIEWNNFTFPVTAIDNSAFEGCTSLKSIIVPGTVTNLWNRIFTNCTSLETVILPESVISIGHSIFAGCTSLKSISLPSGITALNDGLFKGCESLRTLKIPDLVNIIGPQVFQDCSSLESVSIPNHVTKIDGSCFKNCKSLTNIILPNSILEIVADAFMNCETLKGIILPSEIQFIGENAFRGCKSLESIILPEHIAVINQNIFRDCNSLTSIEIPLSVKEIKKDAFYNCKSIKEIHISDLKAWNDIDFGLIVEGPYVYNIYTNPLLYGGNLYLNGEKIEDLILPETIIDINPVAFWKSSFNSVTLGSKVTNIPYETFISCTNLKTVLMPPLLKKIYNSSFAYCESLSSLKLPIGLNTIDQNAFLFSSNITDIYVNNPISSFCKFYDSSFMQKVYDETVLWVPKGSLESYIYSSEWNKFKNIQEISYKNDEFFEMGSLRYHIISDTYKEVEISSLINTETNLTVPDKIIHNGEEYTVYGLMNECFKGSQIESVDLPETILYVGLNSFMDCENLNQIELHSTNPPTISTGSFDPSHFNKVKVIIPECSYSLYSTDPVWSLFTKLEDGTSKTSKIQSDMQTEMGSIYDLTGRQVLMNATMEQINRLEKGIYICNGKKILVK